MHEAAQAFIGTHDFTTFRDADCQAASPVKTLNDFQVRREGEHIFFTCRAQSFIHRQVRSMVGSLIDVGRGKQPVGWAKDILDAADRTECGPIAPADGLYLTQVDYD